MRLLIGYGNTLRSDDGAGQKIANIVSEWNLPQWRSLSVHQLTPELALDIAQADLVIFVDATIQTELEIIKLVPATDKLDKIGHSSHPNTLLSLSQTLYNHLPQAYWILIPGVNFGFGEEFSPVTQQAINIALKHIRILTEFS